MVETEIVVLPGMDLNGYDFAERLTAALPEEETPPTEPGTEPIPNPTPMPIDEPVQTPLAGFVPLPTVEWRRSANVVQEETIAEPAASSSRSMRLRIGCHSREVAGTPCMNRTGISGKPSRRRR